MSELVPYQDKVIESYEDMESVAKAMVSSGFFTDSTKVSQAIVKIMAGREIGIGPFTSMNGIYIIKGRPAFGANLMAAKVKASGKYNYRVLELSDQGCSIEFYEMFNSKWEKTGVSSFTAADAKKAGTQNTDKFPRNMYFARALSNGVRWYCPDVMNGSAVYTPDELGADTDEDGNVITVEAVEVQPSQVEDERPAMTAERANAALGIVDDDEPEPVKTSRFTDEQVAKASAVFSETAGKTYGELTVPELAIRATQLLKSLKDNGLTKSQRNAIQDKIEAAKLLMELKRQPD